MGGTHLHKCWQSVDRHLVSIPMQPAISGNQGCRVPMPGPDRRDFRLAGAPQLLGITRHHFVTVGNQGFKRLFVGDRANVAQLQARRRFLHTCQTQFLHQADIDPANVKLVRLHRKLGRCRVGVVVVMQLLSANQHTPGHDVGAGVGCLEIAVAPIVTNAVDDSGCSDRNPCHLHGPHGQTERAKQRQVHNHHQAHTLPAVAGVHIAFKPVVRATLAITA